MPPHARPGLRAKQQGPARDAQDDETLLALYARGDAAAARALCARFTPMVHGLAFRLLGDRAEAEDVTQEAMLRLWKIAPRWRPGEARVGTWLYRVACNLCTDRLRRRRPLGLDEIAEPVDGRPRAEASVQQAQRLAALEQALADLPERQHVALVLRHVEGRSNPEIAMILGTSVEAVESLLSRGKRGLKRRLAGRKDELGRME